VPSDASPNPPPIEAAQIPRVAITVGDVAGVGPELALKCASLSEVTDRCVPVLIGPAGVLSRVASTFGLTMPPSIRPGEWESLAADTPGPNPTVDAGALVVDVGELNAWEVEPGRFTAASGASSFAAVEFGIRAALAGRVDALVTGPIQKEAWREAGVSFPGHTELLAERTGVRDVRMMLTGDAISCALVTIHMPLADVPKALTIDGIVGTIRMAAEAMRCRLGREPRVSVCGLNPHAGENGMFSRGEESAVIEPALRKAESEGYHVRGPLPPDTAFTPNLRQLTDVYICMYHDQGLIPLKAICFEDAVNVTLGLPIVRTSVDHGTALDLAWQGRADHRSMLAAIAMAIELSR